MKMKLLGFNPFDPIQDTESVSSASSAVRPASFNPFDPIQDTESRARARD